MKNATMKRLYTESQRWDEYNSVSVELRQWSKKSGSSHIVNTILISSVWIGDDRAVYREQCLTNRTDAEMIRLAINEFDKLMKSHPETYAASEAQS